MLSGQRAGVERCPALFAGAPKSQEMPAGQGRLTLCLFDKDIGKPKIY